MVSTTRTLWALFCVSMLATGCSVPRLDVTSKACPCAEGWTCDERSNRCVRGARAPGDASDGGQGSGSSSDASDASLPDAQIPGIERDASPADATLASEGGPRDTPVADGGLSTDAAPSDASFVAVCDGLPTSVLTDGFEASGGFTYSYSRTGSALDRRHAGFAHGGTKSLRVETTEPGPSACVSDWLEDPIMECSFHVSTYVYVDAAVQVRSFGVFSIADQTGQAIRLLYTQDGLRLEVDATASSFALDPQVEVMGRWVHVELIVKIGLEGELLALIDGNEALRVTTSTERPLGYSQVRLGLVSSSPDQGPIVLYVDDFRLTRVLPSSL